MIPVLVADEHAVQAIGGDALIRQIALKRCQPDAGVKEKIGFRRAEQERVSGASAGERSKVEHGGWYQRREGRLNGLRMMRGRDDAIGDPTGPWESTQ